MPKGKFEGEPKFVEYFWELALDGCADIDTESGWGFVIDEADIARHGLPADRLGKTLELTEDDQGFITHQWI